MLLQSSSRHDSERFGDGTEQLAQNEHEAVATEAGELRLTTAEVEAGSAELID